MKNILFAAIAGLTIFASCTKETTEEPINTPAETGTFMVEFENYVGNKVMILESDSSSNYKYQTQAGQAFNVSEFAFYASEFTLSGPNGESFTDYMNVSANEDDVHGYYRIMQNISSSKTIGLQGVPYGTYDQISFVVGINEAGVQAGAAGGVLDPANGAPFWNWNTGYIAVSIAGSAADAGTENKQYEVHIGGWKDMPADSNGVQMIVNNVKTITLNFDSPLIVSENLSPMGHIKVDAGQLFNTDTHDFKTHFSIHAPKKGQPYANQLNQVFSFEHSHQ